MRILALTLALLTLAPALAARADLVVDFEDLALPPNSANNTSGGFTSRGASFNNEFTDFGSFISWSGWAYSNRGDTATPGFTNQFSSYAGGGFGGSGNFGVAFTFSPNDAYVNLPTLAEPPISMTTRITNTTYAALSMLRGDQFAKKFGGPTGDDPDFFLLTITGYSGADATGGALGSVPFYLADYRFADNTLDYVVDSWELVDLSSLVGARSLGFALTSSDVGEFGMNTPAYFALDELRIATAAIPEPSSLALAAIGVVALMAGHRMRRKRAA